MTSLSHAALKHHSRKADFAQTLMSSICGDHQLDTSCRNELDFHYDGIRLFHKRIAMGTICYGANVAINISNLKSYSISLPLQGKQTLNLRGEQYSSNPNKGLIVSNAEMQSLFIDKSCTKLQVAIPERSIQIVLSDLLKKPIHDPVIFNPEMCMENNQFIAAWWNNVQNFLQLKPQYLGLHGLEMLSEDYENFIIKALLLSQENNYSYELNGLSNAHEPLYIRRIRDFIIEHVHEDIDIESLIQIAGVSKSKLYEEFQQYYGTSPMLYLRKYRLQQIYKILTNAGVNRKVSISQLAYEWGFNHLGRFSQEYKDEFGEKPSETKNRFL